MSTRLQPSIASMLDARLPLKQVKALMEHFGTMIDQFQFGNWETATVRSGKFVESTLKTLWAHLGNPIPRAKEFTVDKMIRSLEQVPASKAGDTVRLTIPRACRFIYEIASNRGARHDCDEINPNQMDASVAVAVCSWIVAELVRFAQDGSVEPGEAAKIVVALTQKRYPPIEEVDGRTYFHLTGLSAREVALLALWKVHPGRMSTAELIAAAARHGSSMANAKMGVSRLRHKVTDDDGQGNLRLLAPGIEEAERLISTREQRTNNSSASSEIS